MKLSFFDLQTRRAYTLIDNALHTLKKKPRNITIICPSLSYFTHLKLEAQREYADNEQLSSLLFGLAYEKAALNEPIYAYEFYFIAHAHLFDEQKCIYECFFYHKHPAFKAQIITNDMFLPCALRSFGIKAHLLIWIESFLCYFEASMLKEVLPYTSITLDETLSQISSHIIYLQEAYHQHFEQIYYFMPNAPQDEELLYINTPHHTQQLKLAPLSETIKQDTLTFEAFRALLSLHYAESKPPLANFAPKGFKHKRLYALSACVLFIFICIIPLSLALYNQSLHHTITELNSQSEVLFTPKEAEHDRAKYESIEVLKAQQEALLAHLKETSLWQQTYHKRYIFMQDIHKAPSKHIKYEDMSFYFTPYVFIATLKVSAQSQIHISELLALLNTPTQNALLQEEIEEIQENEDISHFHAHIMVIRHAI
ncbi:hypothetical protein [Helicobacter marmotae]|uniref:Uncharacterized protein n=1 Tax=Helicobacter marmotae TaxID=152490 RepID=A0A3D8I2V7_9HELI|nr:hypothetical protein [Helicobacter marmotae]RDU59459.1 hypothetical protein CQA63_06800 [Helicobacter marmotae]